MICSHSLRFATLALLSLSCSPVVPAKAPSAPAPSTPPVAPAEPPSAARELPPQAAPVAPKPFPAIVSGTLANGLSLDVIERHGLPIVSLTLVIGAGQVADGDRAAVARTTAQLLEAGGAGRFDSESLRQAVDGLGANLSTVTTRDTSRWSLTVTSDRIGDALEILAAIAYQPRFDAVEFGKLRTRELERVRSLAKTSGAWLSQYWLHRELYAQPLGIHPYASVDVLPSELSRLSLRDCKQFHKERYVPGNARLIAVGDVGLASLTQQAQAAFGKWSGKLPPDKGIGAPTVPEKLTVSIIDRPGSTQSDILIGLFGPSRDEDTFPAVVAMQQLLGGGVASRLFVDIREKRSLAYSTYAVSQEVAAGPTVLSLAAGTQTPKTAEAVGALLENVELMRTAPGDEAELDVAKNYVVYGMPAAWETVDSLARQLILLRTLKQSERHFDELREAVTQLKPDALRAPAARFYRKDRAVIVVAGDADAIAESLRQFGPVQVLDPQREFSIKRKLDPK
jgi:predicted Zn-dependent peptidase